MNEEEQVTIIAAIGKVANSFRKALCLHLVHIYIYNIFIHYIDSNVYLNHVYMQQHRMVKQ